MRQPRRLGILISSLLLLTPALHAAGVIAVNESATKSELRDSAMTVRLAVDNASGHRLRALIELELLDPKGQSHGRASLDQDLSAGSSKVRLEVPLPKLKPDEVFQDRLAYKITVQPPAVSSVEPLSGIIAVSEISPVIFELQIAYPGQWQAGGPVHALVRAVQPHTSRPVAGVKIRATLDANDADSTDPLQTSAVTNSRGYAAIGFNIPLHADTENPDLTITGELGGYIATLNADGSFLFHFSKFLLSTDKPLYQPGQTLHARVLAVGPDHRAFAAQPIEIRVLDPDDNLVYKANLTTSRFGIAGAEWTIPVHQPLGTYSVQAGFADDDSDENGGSTTVKISRYDLPNFAVKVKPDRAYYLPGQNAEVTVRADYLFGQPVTRGHVRVVRENERTWNFHDQKWNIDEGTVYEGELDASGAFVAKIDLAGEHEELGGSDYERFRDIRYTAYLTDPSSARTEERRFDLRVTKDRIHIYILESGRVTLQHSLDFYISTSYADGTPASCDVSIEAEPPKNGGLSPVLRKVHTNRYGVAKIADLRTGPEEAQEVTLAFRATDSQGATGVHSEYFWNYHSSVLRVSTDKVFYHPDDPIQVNLTSDDSEAAVEVEAAADMRFIASRTVQLHHGRASFAFDPSDKFQGAVTISAYELGRRPDTRMDDTYAQGYHTVLFPHDTSLRLAVHLSKATYRPGEDAQADFHVSTPNGDSPKSALGLAIVDKAVEERRRTDQDLNAYSGFFGFLGEWDSSFDLAGIHRADLDKIDLAKPVPAGYDVVAEILLQQGEGGSRFESSDDEPDLDTLFAGLIDPPLAPVLKSLEEQAKLPKSPGGEEGIRHYLESTSFPGLRDPWGTPYRAQISPQGADYAIQLQSAGPDKKFDTDDDFHVGEKRWPYFLEEYAKIQSAIDAYHARTGAWVRDLPTFQRELLARRFSFDSLRDPWGHAYRADFTIERNYYVIAVVSPGPDGRFSTPDAPSSDDVVVFHDFTDYFLETRSKIDAALARYFQNTGNFPQIEKDLADALHSAGVDWDSLRDPWGNRYYATFRSEAAYTDAFVIQSYADYQAGQRTTVHPVTAQINFINIRSAGPDAKPGTQDDFDAATFSRATYVGAPTGTNSAASMFSGSLGAISGTITDPSGGAVAGAKVIATREATLETYEATAGADGVFTVRNVRPGPYIVRCSSPGFRDTIFTSVPVGSSAVTQLNAVLQVGTVSQTVTVEASVALLQTTQSSVANARRVDELTAKFPQGKGLVAPLSTPRLREYFPETLLWQPELLTDSRGSAHLKFPLADSITTWKLSAVASTADGRIGTAEKELRAFQPFFADQDLPQFLTAGDEIGLPVILRNFLDHSESVDLKVAPQPWLTLLGPAAQRAEVASNDSARAIFPMRAELPVKEGRQRVTATGKTAADAIEKKTTVRPFGQEKTAGESQILKSSASLDVSIPQNALPGSIESELKIYPNLMAHVWEAIEAILERPYGCGEQTISSTYPSVLLLQYAKQTGHENSPQVAKARKYAQLGYDRLLSYQAEDGGFTYWGARIQTTSHSPPTP